MRALSSVFGGDSVCRQLTGSWSLVRTAETWNEWKRQWRYTRRSKVLLVFEETSVWLGSGNSNTTVEACLSCVECDFDSLSLGSSFVVSGFHPESTYLPYPKYVWEVAVITLAVVISRFECSIGRVLLPRGVREAI